MGDGSQERVANPLRFRSDPRLFSLFLQAGALQSERDLGGERLDQVALFRKEETAPLHRLHGQYTQHLMTAVERQILRDGSRQSIGSEPRGRALVVYPLG